MKRLFWLVLLLSLGLNLGLGYRVLKTGDYRNDFPRGYEGQHRGLRPKGEHTAQEPGQKQWPGHRDSTAWKKIMSRRLDRIAHRLGLSEEQVMWLRTVQQKNVGVFSDQRSRLEEARRNLHEIVSSGTVEPNSIREAIHEVGFQQARLDSLVTEAVLVEMEILDVEQRGRYLQLLPVLRQDRPGRGGEGRSRFRDQ